MFSFEIKEGSLSDTRCRVLNVGSPHCGENYFSWFHSIGCEKTRLKKSLKIPQGNQNPYIGEEQTTQWQNERVHKDKQQYTKHTHKTKDRVTRT